MRGFFSVHTQTQGIDDTLTLRTSKICCDVLNKMAWVKMDGFQKITAQGGTSSAIQFG